MAFIKTRRHGSALKLKAVQVAGKFCGRKLTAGPGVNLFIPAMHDGVALSLRKGVGVAVLFVECQM
jgi:hypothetical protein